MNRCSPTAPLLPEPVTLPITARQHQHGEKRGKRGRRRLGSGDAMPGDAGADRTLRVAGACLIVAQGRPEREETEQRVSQHGRTRQMAAAAAGRSPGAARGLGGGSAGAQGVQGSPPRPRPLVPAPPVAPTTAPAAHDITAEGPHRRALHRAGRCADEDGDEDGADVMLRSGRGRGGGSRRLSAPRDSPRVRARCSPVQAAPWLRSVPPRCPQPNPPRAGGCERRANPPGSGQTDGAEAGWTDGRR